MIFSVTTNFLFAKNYLSKALKNPIKASFYIWIAIKKRVSKKKDVLLIIGADPNGELAILNPGYKNCYVFEANPERYKKLFKKYHNCENINIYNFAVTDYDGEIELNISSNNQGASSSVGNFKDSWINEQSESEIKMVKSVTVPCINLFNFCKKNAIEYIDDYISDIQGLDLHVLKTMRPMIKEKKIASIKCEVTKDQFGNVYDLPDNSETGFMNLLSDNYELVAKGYGLLLDYKFEKIPEEAWEMDCKWKLRR